MRPMKERLFAVFAMIASVGFIAAVGLNVSAQGTDSTPTPQSELNLSAGIYQGACGTIGDEAVYGVGDLISVSQSDIIGFQDLQPILRSEATIDAALEELFSQDETYSFVVRDNNEDAPDDVVACGELGGVMVRDQVVVGLFATNSPDYVGVAIFSTPEESIPNLDRVYVQAYLFESALAASDTDTGTPTATSEPEQEPVVSEPTTPSRPVSPPTPTPAPILAPTLEPTVAPTATTVPVTATMVPPTGTMVPPTATMAPPTATMASPTPTLPPSTMAPLTPTSEPTPPPT